MAAASAGAIQAGFSSGTIAPSTSQLQQQHHSGKWLQVASSEIELICSTAFSLP